MQEGGQNAMTEKNAGEKHAGRAGAAARATLRDAVYGQAVGDALGVPYEFRARGTFECRGMIGDDTDTTAAVAGALAGIAYGADGGQAAS